MKEGGIEQLMQVAFNVILGSLISNLVCFWVWPQSATVNLQRDMISSLESYSTLLDMLIRTFLLDPQSKGKGKLMRAVEAHQKSFTSLKRNLDEARSEWVLDPPDLPDRKRKSGLAGKSTSELYGEAVDSLNRLGQHLAGLRGGTRLQLELSAAKRAGRIVLPEKRQNKDGRAQPPTEPNGKEKGPLPAVSEVDEEDALLNAAAQMFGDLVDDVGPPMTALTVSLLILKHG